MLTYLLTTGIATGLLVTQLLRMRVRRYRSLTPGQKVLVNSLAALQKDTK